MLRRPAVRAGILAALVPLAACGTRSTTRETAASSRPEIAGDGVVEASAPAPMDASAATTAVDTPAESAVEASSGEAAEEAGRLSLDAAIDRLVEAAGGEGRAGAGPAEVADLDGDGVDEALVQITFEGGSSWNLLADSPEGYVSIAEDPVGSSEARLLSLPDGTRIVVSQHDCCCTYRLDVARLDRGARALTLLHHLETGCAEGCDDGYQARLRIRDGVLQALEEPVDCGRSAPRVISAGGLVP